MFIQGVVSFPFGIPPIFSFFKIPFSAGLELILQGVELILQGAGLDLEGRIPKKGIPEQGEIGQASTKGDLIRLSK